MADKIANATTGDRDIRAAWMDQPRSGDWKGLYAFPIHAMKQFDLGNNYR